MPKATSIYETIDPRFRPLTNGDVRLEQIYDDCRWAEGPAYSPAGRYLTWSDIPNDRILRWDETSGRVSVFRHPANYTNGHTIDRQGRLLSCEHGARRVTRTEFDGSITVLADNYQGKRFNSPNDIVVRSDGSIWFTDPAYGIDSDYEGFQAVPELDSCDVYRIDPDTGKCESVIQNLDRPNGLAFTLDERQLYVSDSQNNNMWRFDIDVDGNVGDGAVFATCTDGCFDGFRLDSAGRIWSSAGDGVHCLDPDGTLLGKVLAPETVANVVFGGLKRNHLFMCATTSLYAVRLSVTGAATF
jgi:gluconolactonase